MKLGESHIKKNETQLKKYVMKKEQKNELRQPVSTYQTRYLGYKIMIIS